MASLQKHREIQFQILFTYITPQEPQLTGKGSEHQTPAGLGQHQKSLRCKAQQTLQHSKGETRCVPREPLPEGRGAVEEGKTVGHPIYPFSLATLNGPQLCMCGFPNEPRERRHPGIRMRKSWEEQAEKVAPHFLRGRPDHGSMSFEAVGMPSTQPKPLDAFVRVL